ncbi:MAG: hypothetical protein Q8J90_01945 [Gallionella sp.]|nr:hypothetical protein [Gallionella sp.]
MTAKSPLFIALEARLEALTNKYVADQIPQETDPDFIADMDHLAAYRLLVHAEIEDYLERKARAALDEIDKLLSTGSFNVEDVKVILDLALYFKKEIPLQLPFEVKDFCSAAKVVAKSARDFIDDNNGIKSTSLLVCCLILNKPIDKVDASLVISLNAFGKARGDVAHKSVSRVTSIYAPSAEKQSAHNVIAELEDCLKAKRLKAALQLF